MSETEIFDEMWGRDGCLREPYRAFHAWFEGEDPKRLRAKQREAEAKQARWSILWPSAAPVQSAMVICPSRFRPLSVQISA